MAFCLLFCTLCSLLYDTGRLHPFRHALGLLDHCAIFLLIAGTYAPFAISGIGGPFSIPLLDWVWALAVLGIALRLWLRNRYDRLFILFYLAFGWLFVLSLQSIVANTPSVALDLLGLGGITFSAGAFVYLRSANGRRADAIWHGFVLLGIFLHLGAVLSLTITAER